MLTAIIRSCTGGEARTPDTRFWRPVLYQLRDVYKRQLQVYLYLIVHTSSSLYSFNKAMHLSTSRTNLDNRSLDVYKRQAYYQRLVAGDARCL